MANQFMSVPKTVAAGILLALIAVLFSFGLGGTFGIGEEVIKKYLDDSGKSVLESVYKGDAQKMDAVVKKSFSYLIRSHLHGGAIGVFSLAAICILILVSKLGLIEKLSSLALGIGPLSYSLFWFCVGLKAPFLGNTGAAKNSFELLAIIGGGLSILGLFGVIFSVWKNCFCKQKAA
ncbi:MAG: hypothetical protein LLF28_05260 [Nitrospiraceae bacterium]|nr:hypothetical protein [Nitrospiraceae bacterium]